MDESSDGRAPIQTIPVPWLEITIWALVSFLGFFAYHHFDPDNIVQSVLASGLIALGPFFRYRARKARVLRGE